MFASNTPSTSRCLRHVPNPSEISPTCPTHPSRHKRIPFALNAPSTCPPRLRHFHDTSNVSPRFPFTVPLTRPSPLTSPRRLKHVPWTSNRLMMPSMRLRRLQHIMFHASNTPNVVHLSYTRNDSDIKDAPSPSPSSSSASR